MSRPMCQQEDGIHFLCFVLVHEDCIENPIHTGPVAEYAHRSRPPSYFSESSLDKVRGPYTLPEGRIVELETGE